MILSFTLSMPNVGSWNGRWSGEDRLFVVCRSFRGRKEIANAEKIAEKGYYHYSWGDGWAAGIRVQEVTSSGAQKLRQKSAGFSGYDWMIDSIIQHGEPLAPHQVAARREAAGA
jgi:hypothetical protein